MKSALVALAVLIPALVRADDGRSRPYSLINGRSAGTAAAAGRHASGERSRDRKALRKQEDPPPSFSKPGAWVRTEGQQVKYIEATPARAHTIEGGSFVDIDKNKAQDVGRAPNLKVGPKDALPPPNPGSATSSGGNSITPNSPPKQ